MNTPTIDPNELEAFAARAIGDIASAYSGLMVGLGSKLGLYKALDSAGPTSAAELARRTDCAERYVREWLNAQAAAGYLEYHPASDTYELSPAHAQVLADEDSPYFIPPAWDLPAALWSVEAKTLDAFRSGRGVSWSDQDPRLACGVAAFYRNGYRAHLVSQWLPALDGVVAQLERGLAVADVGCGHGHSTRLMAEAFPRSRFFGFDAHAESIEAARRNAADSSAAQQLEFSVARASDVPDRQFGLVCFFDTLHDLGDPVEAARRARDVLAPGGTVLLVEPFAHDRVEHNLSLVGQLYYGGSTMICCSHALSEGGKLVLGAQAGPARLADVFRRAGFSHFRRAAETPFNAIYEVRR